MATVVPLVPRSDTFAELSAAIARAQAAMRHPAATKTNPRFHNRYADLADVIDDGLRRLTDEGISITPWIEITGDQLSLTLLLALGEQWTLAGISVPLEQPNPQAIGSALTYARRYLYLTLCGVATGDDDDGERASTPPTPRKITAEKVDEIRQAAAGDGVSPTELGMWVDIATAGRSSDPADLLYSELDALRAARKAWLDQTAVKTSSVRP